jgi:hypothetical protein
MRRGYWINHRIPIFRGDPGSDVGTPVPTQRGEKTMTDTGWIDYLEQHPVAIYRENDGTFLVRSLAAIGRGPDLRTALESYRESSRSAALSHGPLSGPDVVPCDG